MLDKKPRLCVLVSDTCNSFAGETAYRGITRTPDWEKVRQLMLVPRGLVDINSISEGEAAVGDNNGGFFTGTLIDSIREPFQKLDVNRDRYLTWEELLPRLQTGAQEKYATYRAKVLKAAGRSKEEQAEVQKQEYQTVRVFGLPPLYRFGVRVMDAATGGGPR